MEMKTNRVIEKYSKVQIICESIEVLNLSLYIAIFVMMVLSALY